MTGTVKAGVSVGAVLSVVLSIAGYTIKVLHEGQAARIAGIEVEARSISDRVARVEVRAEGEEKRLERMELKIDKLLEQGGR